MDGRRFPHRDIPPTSIALSFRAGLSRVPPYLHAPLSQEIVALPPAARHPNHLYPQLARRPRIVERVPQCDRLIPPASPPSPAPPQENLEPASIASRTPRTTPRPTGRTPLEGARTPPGPRGPTRWPAQSSCRIVVTITESEIAGYRRNHHTLHAPALRWQERSSVEWRKRNIVSI